MCYAATHWSLSMSIRNWVRRTASAFSGFGGWLIAFLPWSSSEISTSCQGWIPNDHGRARLGIFTAVATRLFSRLWLCFGPVCNHICRGRKAWSGDAPSAEDMARLLREYPQATHVAATRRGVAEVNRLALQALYAGAAPVAHLPGTYEDAGERNFPPPRSWEAGFSPAEVKCRVTPFYIVPHG